jgi:hypothetical protein
MSRLSHWWNSLPESYRAAIIAGVLASIGWFAVKLLTLCVRVISGFYQKRKLRNIELLARGIWEFIKQQSGGSTTAIRLSLIVSHFGIPENRAIEALRNLQAKGLLRPNFDESLWFSDAGARFFN